MSLFVQHQPLLEKAIQALHERTFFAAFPEHPSPAIYGESVEAGTKPHFPPVAPIRHWVERKLGITGKEAGSVAFLIARAISKRGTKGAGMFEKSFDENEAAVIRILEMIPADIIRAAT